MALSPSAKSDATLVLVTVIAAISWIFSKEAVLGMPPILFMAVRFFLAALCLAFVSAQHLQRLTGPLLRRSITVGVFFGFGMATWVMGLASGDSMGEGAFITSLGVILVPVVARLGFGEVPSRSTWYALPVAAAGLAMLSLENGFTLSAPQLYFLASAFFIALFYTLNTQATNTDATGTRKPVHPLALTTVVMCVATLVTSAASFAVERNTWASFTITPALVGWVVASATIGTALRFYLQTYAQSLSNRTNGAVILVLEPIWVALFSAFWFSERLSNLQLLGCTIIFTALLINRWNVISQGIKKWMR